MKLATYAEFRSEVEGRAVLGQTVTQIAQWARQFAPGWAGTQRIRSIVLAKRSPPRPVQRMKLNLLPKVKVELAELHVIRQADWKVHGNATYGDGLWGKVTECEARGVHFFVRENIRGDQFMISATHRAAMKRGQIPTGFEMVLDVAAPAKELPWILDLVRRRDARDHRASQNKRKAPARRAVTHAAFTMNTAPEYFGSRGR